MGIFLSFSYFSWLLETYKDYIRADDSSLILVSLLKLTATVFRKGMPIRASSVSLFSSALSNLNLGTFLRDNSVS
jgi:hypothetical protein